MWGTHNNIYKKYNNTYGVFPPAAIFPFFRIMLFI